MKSLKFSDYKNTFGFLRKNIQPYTSIGGGSAVGACVGAYSSDTLFEKYFSHIQRTILGSIGGGIIGGILGYRITQECDKFFYNSWKKQHTFEAVESMNKLLSSSIDDPEMVCLITQEAAIDAVRTPHTNYVYERSALEQWIKENHTDPATRQPVNIEDITISGRGFAIKRQMCRNALIKIGSDNQEAQSIILSIHDENEKNAKKFISLEMHSLLKSLEKNLITLNQYESKAAHLLYDINISSIESFDSNHQYSWNDTQIIEEEKE
jgi:hypothetical protein